MTDTPRTKDKDFGATPLAIIGIGCLFPKADNTSAYWANIREGIDAITDIPATHWRPEDYFDADQKRPDHTYGRRGGFLSPLPFNPMEFNIPPTTLEAIDTSQLLGLVAAGQALKDAGYGPERQFDKSKVSVVLGVTGTLELVIPLGARLGHPIWRQALKEAGVDDTTAQDVVERISDGYVPWQENSFPGLLGNVVAGRISKQYDLGGTNCVVDAACASSFSALHLAGMELATGKSDMVVTGGVDTFNDIFMYMCFSKTPALSPTGNAKPFDASGDGTILGEGLGLVVIKRLADAERDGDRIYAVIRGIGSSSDGKGEAIYAPSASGQRSALRDAYQRADVSPQSIGLLEAHGTGTKVGDGVEVSALREVYGEAEHPWCALGSVKSQIGHTKAAAGAAGLIKAVLALHHKVIPPTIKVNEPLPEVTGGRTPFYLTTDKRPWLAANGAPRRAAVSAFGFGGSNFHTVLEEYRPAKETTDWDGTVQILPFGADSAVEVEKQLVALPTDLSWNGLRARAAELRAAFNPNVACRLAMVVEQTTDLATLMSGTLTMLRSNPSANWQHPAGAFYATAAANGKVAALFPGQGAQYTGMLRDLACTFPEIFTTLATADAGFTAADGARLSDRIYPQTPFDGTSSEQREEQLRATDVAQPAIGAVSLGAYRLLERFGFAADAAAGHSYGELTALCAAGRLNEDAFHELSRLRGRLMAEGTGDKGSMLAVQADIATIEQVLAEEKLDLVLANRNAPHQAVLSGVTTEIVRAAESLKQRKIPCKQLPVAAAFHSPLVADAATPFMAALADITISDGQMPTYANTTAAPYPTAPEAARELLANQLARPVEFVAEIEALYTAGCRTFVEIGPGARLTGLIKAILGEREHNAIALDSSNGKRSGIVDLARTLAQLAVLGLPIRLGAWDGDYRPADATGKKPLMTVPICGANYVKPRDKRPPVMQGTVSGNRGPANLGLETTQQPAIGNQKPTATPQQPLAPSSRDALVESLRVTRESMAILQRMQEETAQLHRKFLEGQEAAGRTIQALLHQQQQFLSGGSDTAHSFSTGTPSPAVSTPSTLTAASSSPVVAPAPAAIAPAVSTPAVSTAAMTASPVTETLLTVVSEKTGYPVEMLGLEMGLDTDLGIDSIKRVEILSALQEQLPGAPVIGPEQLGSLQTLGEIAQFLGAGAAVQASHAAPLASATIQGSASSASTSRVTETLLAVVSEKTGYPVEMLGLEMGLDTDLGIDSIKRVEILSALQEQLPGAPIIGPEQLGSLQTLGEIAQFLGAGTAVEASHAAPLASATMQGTASSSPTSHVTATLLTVVSEKTGYPVEMLGLEMGMEADLGIDSIKRVEILSALQEQLPGAPVIGPEQLGSLHTLGEIAAFLGAGSTVEVQLAATPVPIAIQGAPSSAPTNDVTGILLAVVSDKTGYPVEMLGLEMGMEADLGIDSIKRVEILSALQEQLPGAPVIGPEQLGTLHTLGEIASFLTNGSTSNSTPAASSPPAPVQPATHIATADAAVATPRQHLRRSILKTDPLSCDRERLPLAPGALWLTDDGAPFVADLYTALTEAGATVQLVRIDEMASRTVPASLAGLIIAPPAAGTDDRFIIQAFTLVQRCAPALRRAGESGGALLATVSRLDGAFGCNTGSDIVDPLSGGLAGLAKTASFEWPEVTCRAIDLGDCGEETTDQAAALAAELLRHGPLETGITASGPASLTLTDLAPTTTDIPPIQPGEVVLVTGGGRGVTAAAAVALAKAWRPTLVLLGRSPEPAEEPDWLTQLTDESRIKRALLEHAGKKLHPKEIEERFQQVMAGRELRATMAAIAAVGGNAIYHPVDIRNSTAVAILLAELRRQYGPIRGIVHGAGVLADRLIVDKTREQFSQVYDTKVAGLRSLLAAVGDDELRALALFSSTTGRFGRTGQVDYAVANEVLNKMAQVEARRRPYCRVVSINWGPWDGGMVTPSLKKVFAGEGIGLISLAAGGDFLVTELATADAQVEVTVLAEVPTATAQNTAPARSVKLVTAFERTMTIEDHPFLRSHVLDGNAVLPMAMIMEWFAHGALHGNPGLRFHGCNDLRICKGVILDAEAPHRLQVLAGKAEKHESLFIVPMELRTLGRDGKTTLNARADIVLTTKFPVGIRSITELPTTPYEPHKGVIYHRERLFHGPDLHGIVEVEGCSSKGIAAQVKGAPAPSTWIRKPLRNTWLTDPLAIDSAFQLMILWSFQRTGAGSLPTFAGRYRQFRESFPKDGVQVAIKVTEQREHGATADIEFLDRASGKLVARIEHYECVIDPSLARAFQRNQLQKAGVA